MPKRTLPRAATPGALYVLAVAAGVLLSKPLAIVLAVLATAVLALVTAGTQVVQRRFPDLGRLPLVEDHGFYERLRESTKLIEREPGTASITESSATAQSVFSPAPPVGAGNAAKHTETRSAATRTPAPKGSSADALAARLIGEHQRRESAIKRGEELLRMIFDAEGQQENAIYKASPRAFYTLAALVEAWARKRDVPQHRGDPGADLARLKTFVQMEIARLEQE